MDGCKILQISQVDGLQSSQILNKTENSTGCAAITHWGPPTGSGNGLN